MVTPRKKAKDLIKTRRPTLYKPQYCKLLIAHFRKGLSYKLFATDIKVHPDTLYEWEKVHPEFSDAKTMGLLESQRFWESLVIKAMLKNERFNTSAWIFCMKNKFKWVDRQPEEIENSKIEPIIVEMPMSGQTLQIGSGKKGNND